MNMPTFHPAVGKSLAVCVTLCVAVTDVQGADTPQFKQGLWEFNRTADGAAGGAKALNTQKCTDPTQLFNKNTQIPGCKFSALTRSGNTYSFTADCTIQGAALTSKTVIAVENESAYTQTVESQGGGQQTKEVLVAKRVGDCAQ